MTTATQQRQHTSEYYLLHLLKKDVPFCIKRKLYFSLVQFTTLCFFSGKKNIHGASASSVRLFVRRRQGFRHCGGFKRVGQGRKVAFGRGICSVLAGLARPRSPVGGSASTASSLADANSLKQTDAGWSKNLGLGFQKPLVFWFRNGRPRTERGACYWTPRHALVLGVHS
jgi:hypothetical protein